MSSKIPQRPAVDGSTRVIERPDGFYWIDEDTREESGPFATLEQAVADMQAAAADTGYEVGESLQEAEAEIGIADWIDPDTGEPAEESVPRIEDH